jgi:predicted sugar kinase
MAAMTKGAKAMATTFAERLQQGVGLAEKLADSAVEALPPDGAERIEARMHDIARRARRGIERASDARDEARITIKRYPFAATGFAFGVGALLGVAAACLAGACARSAVSSVARSSDEDRDVEC